MSRWCHLKIEPWPSRQPYLYTRLSSDTTTHPLSSYTKVTLQGASSYIITSTTKVRFAEGAIDVCDLVKVLKLPTDDSSYDRPCECSFLFYFAFCIFICSCMLFNNICHGLFNLLCCLFATNMDPLLVTNVLCWEE
jgi:hypothetical protein